ncbi:hypothetical protein SCAR479_09411 [Seiridium cardinale]|uniref:Rho-GAP domain-containing protein n=1 Tax=Seiridium cardinale TaxID=138064 RepID=A0ABR2XJE0_9PEZI
MQFYIYDTAPSKGKERAVDNDPSSSKPVSFPRRSPITRPRVSQDIFHCPQNALPKLMTAEEGPSSNPHDRRPYCSSNTWTSSSADVNLVSEDDEAIDPEILVVEYNRLARKHGIRPLVLDDFRPGTITTQSLPNRRSSWIARILQQVSTTHAYGQPVTAKFDPVLRYRRSISDIALNFVHNQRKEGLQNEDLRGLVRLCGKSIFYLPTEYAPASLVLPTCLRATGQYLVQHAQTSGIFRIPGSVRIVNALYDYYCADIHGEDVATTTRCPNLPSHLNCGVHDVASTFKRLLAGLPGGILGSLSLFDALVAIHSQLHGYAEASRTKEGKLRPRLIALAISTVKSKYQRELICAVLGLLCLIGRAAENAPREDSSGRPLPTSDMMGYSSLAIIFGPLLVGDLLNSYSMKLADPASGLILLPLTPCKSSRHRRAKKTMQQKPSILTVDKILVANDITEMLLIHWRAVVRHLKSLKAMRKGKIDSVVWRDEGGFAQYKLPSRSERSISPLPTSTSTPTPSPRLGDSKPSRNDKKSYDSLFIKRRRQQAFNSAASNPMSRGLSMNALSPTVEESPTADHCQSRRQAMQTVPSAPGSYESGKNGLPWMHSAADPSLAVGELPSSRAPHLQPASQHRGRMFRLDDATKPPNEEANQARPRTEFRTAANYPQQGSDSSQETTKKLQSIATPDVDQTQEQVVTLMDNSTGGYLPCHHNVNFLPTLARNPTLGENDAHTSSISFSHNRVTPGDNSFGSKYMSENMMLPHGCSIGRTVLSEGALPLLSGMNKFPSYYYTSVVGPMMTPPEYVPIRQFPDRSQKINHQDQIPALEASGNWSRQHLLSRNTPHSPLPKSEPIECGREHQSSTSARKRSATTKWRELVHSSPPSSSADLREKRMARHSVHLSSPQTTGPLPNTARRAPTPEWKRQLVKKRSGWKKRSPTWSPEKNNVFEKSPSRAFPGQALSSDQEGFSPTKPSEFVSIGSVSQRDVSKPASGMVKSIAARFDSASQESTSSRSTVLHSRSQSNLRGLRSFRSQDAANQSPAKSFETSGSLPTIDRSHESVTAKVNGNSEKGEYSPGRFRDSINRFSHGLKQSATIPKANETPSRLSSSLAHTDKAFTSARNEPQATFLGQGQLKLEPDHVPSRRAISPPREDPLTASHLDSVRRPSYASAQSHITPWRSDESALLEQYSPSPGSSSILHTQIRNLKKQLESRNEEIRGFRRQLDALYGTDVWTLTEQLRQAKRERNMWRKRAETAEKRVAMFEEFTEKFKGLKESINSVTVSKGYEATAPISPSNGKQESGLASSSSCCNHTENQEAFNNRIRLSFNRYARTGGGDGAYSPQTDQRDAGERLDVGQRDKRWRDISKATAQLWIAAEELLNS